MRATAAPEEGNKVRLHVEIDESEIDDALDEVLRRLSRQVRVPGFRPGKVPRKVLEARMGGPTALRSEAIREAVPEFYARAVADTEVDPIDQPDIDITAGDEGGPVEFDAVVLVRPTVAIPGYGGLKVTVPGLDVTDDEVTDQIDRLRATAGELVEVDRPVAEGDQVTLDVHGTRVTDGSDDAEDDDADDADAEDAADADLQAEDYLYRVGSGAVVPELDEHLVGATAGATLTFRAALPDDSGEVDFRVEVKDVKELVLPEVTDEWAAEASEFDTVAELTDDLTERLRQRKVLQTRMAVQQRTVEALVELVTEEVPEQLVLQELRERIHDLNHRLEAQGLGLAQFLAATGQDEERFLEELRQAAQQSVKADLALRALADAEAIEVDDEELEEELAAMAASLDMQVEQVRDQLERSGRLSAVRSDRRKSKALRWLTDSVELVDEDGTPVPREALAEATDEEDAE